MKEYEYIVLATDEIFSHMISSVICLENYDNKCMDEAFRKIFTYFSELRKDYQEKMTEDDESCDMKLKTERYKMRCRQKREEILESYIAELATIDDTIDYHQKVREHYEKMEKEDIETLEMQLMVYPYLLSLVRKNEECKER